MTTKPEYAKPFDLGHAKAGAPYCCRNGQEATVLKWDRRDVYALVGIHGDTDRIISWTTIGVNAKMIPMGALDLVMLPLGFIDGKPVWVGDHYITSGGLPCITTTASAGDFKGCRWPAPAPVYPTFDGSVDMLSIEYNKNNHFHDSLVRVANFALRHAIDAGQVVLPITQARELAIAEAAAKAVYDKVYQFGRPRTAYCDMGLDLPAIIAGVAK